MASNQKTISIGALIIAIIVPLAVGGISAFLSADAMGTYGMMNKPVFSPPAVVFPIAWTILYVLMGVASYLVFESDNMVGGKQMTLAIYCLQLMFNFFWSLIFFNQQMYLLALVWLLILWFLVIICMIRFWDYSKLAGILMAPYLLWLTFAACLNLAIYLMNR